MNAGNAVIADNAVNTKPARAMFFVNVASRAAGLKVLTRK